MRPTPDQTRAAYDAAAADYAAAFPGTEPEQPLELAMIDHFVDLLREVRDAPEVIDAGCGTGRMARLLTDLGCRVRGIDLSPGMLAIARRDHPDIPVVEGSLTALPYADASADGWFAWYSTMYLTDAELGTAVREAARVVRPGGLALAAFQVGEGSHEVGEAFRALGHDVTLVRTNRSADDLARAFAGEGLGETARMVRSPQGADHEPQAVVIARSPVESAR